MKELEKPVAECVAENKRSKGYNPPTCENSGASYQTRTDDPRFTRAVLYRLS